MMVDPARRLPRNSVRRQCLREGVPIGLLVSTPLGTAGTFTTNRSIWSRRSRINRRLHRECAAVRITSKPSLEDLRTTQDRLVQTEKLASLGQLTAGIAHEIKNPLNFVNNFSAVSVELIDELREALGGVHLDGKLRAEISEIADTLQGNLDKVVQHGKRADAIVKNMLLHSRQGSESTGRSISTPWSMRASISPITGRGPRSRASISPWRGPLTRPPVRSICSRRRSHGRCST